MTDELTLIDPFTHRHVVVRHTRPEMTTETLFGLPMIPSDALTAQAEQIGDIHAAPVRVRMTDETIPPALTADQWAYWLRDPSNLKYHLDSACDHVAYDIHLSRPALAALANAALPDGDPRKITREDLAPIGVARDWFAMSGDTEARDVLARLYAKLAALLPPEGT